MNVLYYILVKHAHLCDYRGNLKTVYVYYTSLCVLAGSVETRIMRVYIRLILYYIISVRQYLICYRGKTIGYFVIYHLFNHQAVLCIDVSCHVVEVRDTPAFRPVILPAIWWWFMELQYGSVTFGSDGLTLLKCRVRYAWEKIIYTEMCYCWFYDFTVNV
jgi:hypothetical protein